MLPIIHVSLRKNNKESGNTEGHRGQPRLPPRPCKKERTDRMREWGFTRRQTGWREGTAVKGKRNFVEFDKKM